MTAEQDGGNAVKRNYYYTQQNPKDIDMSAQDNDDEIKVESSSENEIILIEESKDAI